MKRWYEETARENDVVVSTRIRLARNLQNVPFPEKLSPAKKREIIDFVEQAVLHGNSVVMRNFEMVRMEGLSQNEAVSLVERHLVSPEFIADRKGRALLKTPDESVSVMINEEDHIRLQVMKTGFCLEEVYQTADELDTVFDYNLHFAFDETLGYLTQCPTNLGTGMRASLLLHLPALQESGAMSRLSSSLTKLGLSIRGMYGDERGPVGALYQLSNQVTLGLSEEEAIGNLKSIASQLITKERAAREALVQNIDVQDTICRSLGILQNARKLSIEEFMKLISNVRLGIATGLITNIKYETVNSLIIQVQPATVTRGREMDAQQREALRAQIVSQRLFPVE